MPQSGAAWAVPGLSAPLSGVSLAATGAPRAARGGAPAARLRPAAAGAAEARRGGSDVKKPAPGLRPDLFLQLPFGSGGGVRLSGILSGWPRVPLLSPGCHGADDGQSEGTVIMPSLAIVPVAASSLAALRGGKARRRRRPRPLMLLPPAGSEGSAGAAGELRPAAPRRARAQAAADLCRRFRPGPLEPTTAGGLALRRALRGGVPRQQFPVLMSYELMRLALAPSADGRNHRDEAEALLMGVYAKFLEHTSAPPRPPAASPGAFREYAERFGGAANKALEATASMDFQFVANAHALGLARGAALPRIVAGEARRLYGGAARFGHALRQAELRFQVDGAAGTFVPLSLEAELLREELEELWKQSPPVKGGAAPAAELVPRSAAGPARELEGDEEAAQRSLREALARLARIGEERPGLATYLGWLGRFDPEALSLLAKPAPAVALAIQLQVEAVWGSPKEVNEAAEVAMTPSDLIEAILFGAWLRDAWAEAADGMSRHREAEGDGRS